MCEHRLPSEITLSSDEQSDRVDEFQDWDNNEDV